MDVVGQQHVAQPDAVDTEAKKKKLYEVNQSHSLGFPFYPSMQRKGEFYFMLDSTGVK